MSHSAGRHGRWRLASTWMTRTPCVEQSRAPDLYGRRHHPAIRVGRHGPRSTSRRGPEIVYLFWPIVMAYLLHRDPPTIFARPLAVDEAAGNIEQLLARPHVQSPGEQPGFWPRFREVASDGLPTGNLVP